MEKVLEKPTPTKGVVTHYAVKSFWDNFNYELYVNYLNVLKETE